VTGQVQDQPQHILIGRAGTDVTKSDPQKTTVSRVLVVDDSTMSRRKIAMAIKNLGHEWIEVDSGEAALDFLGGNDVDLVLLDIMRLCCTNPMRDSSCESSVVAGLHEQTHISRLQDQELARIQ